MLAATIWACAPSLSWADVDPCFNHADGALCNDGNPCTLNDRCQTGWCKGDVAANGTECTDGNLCTAMDRCISGLCVGQMVPEGSACDDNNMCTTGEICRGGSCTPQGNLNCNDSNACTAELCIPARGCVYTPLPMCPVDGGAGGTGGAGGAGGAGGMAGTGGGGMSGAGGGTTDAGFDGGFDASPDALVDAPVDARPDAADASAGGADASPGGVSYEVEGGAWFCGFVPHGQGQGAVPLLTALAWLVQRLRNAGKSKSGNARSAKAGK